MNKNFDYSVKLKASDTGSAVLIKQDGAYYLLTAAHVCEGQAEGDAVKITSIDGKECVYGVLAELPWASVPVVEGAAFWKKHYSLNKAIDIFAEALSTNSVPKSFRNQSHREWFERNCQNYKYTFIPATYPTVR